MARPKNDTQPEYFIIPPPNTATVESERKPVLYLPNGKVLVRKVGY